jgi:hypothetical protein
MIPNVVMLMSGLTFLFPCSRNTMENFFNFQSETVKALGIRPDEQAFNAGVFMCDIDQWRTQRITGIAKHGIVAESPSARHKQVHLLSILAWPYDDGFCASQGSG